MRTKKNNNRRNKLFGTVEEKVSRRSLCFIVWNDEIWLCAKIPKNGRISIYCSSIYWENVHLHWAFVCGSIKLIDLIIWTHRSNYADGHNSRSHVDTATAVSHIKFLFLLYMYKYDNHKWIYQLAQHTRTHQVSKQAKIDWFTWSPFFPGSFVFIFIFFLLLVLTFAFDERCLMSSRKNRVNLATEQSGCVFDSSV